MARRGYQLCGVPQSYSEVCCFDLSKSGKVALRLFENHVYLDVQSKTEEKVDNRNRVSGRPLFFSYVRSNSSSIYGSRF